MIKLVFVLRRAPHLDRAQFQAYWLEKHAPLVARLAPTLRIARYAQSHTMSGDAFDAVAAARGCDVEPYDGIAELWWQSLDDMMATASDPAARAGGRELIEDERKFLDLPRCSLFFTREEIIVGAKPTRVRGASTAPLL